MIVLHINEDIFIIISWASSFVHICKLLLLVLSYIMLPTFSSCSRYCHYPPFISMHVYAFQPTQPHLLPSANMYTNNFSCSPFSHSLSIYFLHISLLCLCRNETVCLRPSDGNKTRLNQPRFVKHILYTMINFLCHE